MLAWFANLVMLDGVPFNYLVPDERMLPPESIRFFHVDQVWIDALVDGAFSIGRAAVSGQSLEATHAPMVRALARATPRRRAVNRMLASPAATMAPVSGFLIRSQAVAGWPNLRVNGYRDVAAAVPVNAVRIVHLSNDTMLCLFDAVVAALSLREPPEQLHHGVEVSSGGHYTTLRSVAGGPGPVRAGQQYAGTLTDPEGIPTWKCIIPMRLHGLTIDVAAAADAIQIRLATYFRPETSEAVTGITAAEFALELTQGVVEVEFTQ